MWIYDKKLQYPVRVSKCDVRMAKYLAEQYGGADGELAAALRYLNQRYTIPDKVIGLLTDIGTEESVPTCCRYKKEPPRISLMRLFFIWLQLLVLLSSFY
ncbi:putative CotJC [Paenibacillus sp. 598K]|nr:putative CotJC [Paenibacillus sp. 598K]